jgi:hypothetical protein
MGETAALSCSRGPDYSGSDPERQHAVFGPESKGQDQSKSFVHSPKLIGIEAAGGVSEPLWVHDRGLLDEDSGLGPLE